MRFRSKERGTKIPFLDLSSLRNQTQTLATQATTSCKVIPDVFAVFQVPHQTEEFITSGYAHTEKSRVLCKPNFCGFLTSP